jgi:hypothetical protein
MTAAPLASAPPTPAPLATLVRPVSYGAVRFGGCGAALRAFVRRWGVMLAIVLVAFGAGTSALVHSAGALAAWVVLPLFIAAATPGTLALAGLAQCAAGVMLLWGMRQVLWPTRWALAERALPIPRAQTLRSDIVVVTLALVPLMIVEALGATTLFTQDPALLHETRVRALLALVLARGASLLGGVALLQALRRSTGRPGIDRRAGWRAGWQGRGWRAGLAPWIHRQRSPADSAIEPAARPTARAVTWSRALLWWPLWRGPARRTGAAGCAAVVALCLPSVLLLALPAAPGWVFAAFSLASLLALTRIVALARLELAPLFTACIALPLPAPRLEHARALLCLAPLLPGAVALFGVLLAGPDRAIVRPAVLGLYGLVWSAGCGAEALARPAEATVKASRWLVTLAALVTIGAEVVG